MSTTYTMSDEAISDVMMKFERKLGFIAKAVWAMVMIAFATGAFIARLEFKNQSQDERMNNHVAKQSEQYTAHEVAIKNHGTEINLIHVNEARTAADVGYIKSSLARIEDKLDKLKQ